MKLIKHYLEQVNWRRKKLDSSIDYKFIFFNVGQGDATLILNLQTKESILLDVFKSAPVLKELDSTSSLLSAIFITHWHEDHYRGLPEILEKLIHLQRTIIFYSNYKMHGKENTPKELKRLFNLALHEKIIEFRPLYLSSNQNKILIDFLNFKINLLWPTYDAFFTSDGNNYTSVILNIQINNNNILLIPGDASGECWTKINEQDLYTKIFKFPHHGGDIKSNITAKELIEKVDPEIVVLSTGNSFKHPNTDYCKAVEELKRKVQFYDTRNGDVCLYYHSIEDLIHLDKSVEL